MAPSAGEAGADGRAAAALARPGPGAGDDAVAAARLDHRHRDHSVRRDAGDPGDRDAVGGAARPRSRGGGHRVCLRAGHRPGVGAVPEHGGRRPDGAAGAGAGGVRAERGARAWRLRRLAGGRPGAVAGVSLEAGPGVFGLRGPNGAGKTSLLRMMATVIPPSSGRLRLLGRDPGQYGPRREIRRRLGYLPQNLGYYPGFTVAEVVEYFALLKDMPPAPVPPALSAPPQHLGLGGPPP